MSDSGVAAYVYYLGRTVSGAGSTLEQAVRQCAAALSLAPGRTIKRQQVATGEWLWTWSHRATTKEFARVYQFRVRTADAETDAERDAAAREGKFLPLPAELRSVPFDVHAKLVAAHERLLGTLTATQTRCTELLCRVRELESGMVLPGWTCTACGRFNGALKELRETCSACDAPRPA